VLTPNDILRKPYSRVIIPDETGLFAAELLEFPGCYADGATPEEAYLNLEDVAEAWIESARAQGFPIPEPFADVEHSGTVSLRLPKSIHSRAVQFAYRDGVSLNTFLVCAVSVAVGAEELATKTTKLISEALGRIEALQTSYSVYTGPMSILHQAQIPSGESEPLFFQYGQHSIDPLSRPSIQIRR
jgi:predicted RNase H-like HicB family nuclease